MKINIIQRFMRRKHGQFTLMEILVSCIVLGLGLAGIVAFFPGAIKLGTRVKDKSMAAVVAKTAVATLQFASTDDTMFTGWATESFVENPPASDDEEYKWSAKLEAEGPAGIPALTGDTNDLLYKTTIKVFLNTDDNILVGTYYTYITRKELQ